MFDTIKSWFKPDDSTVDIYTDVGCLYNGKPYAKGAWAFVIPKWNVVRSGKYEDILLDMCGNATNNKSELLAVLNALRFINSTKKGDRKIVIYSDSMYVVNGINRTWKITTNLNYFSLIDKELSLLKHVTIRWNSRNSNEHIEKADEECNILLGIPSNLKSALNYEYHTKNKPKSYRPFNRNLSNKPYKFTKKGDRGSS